MPLCGGALELARRPPTCPELVEGRRTADEPDCLNICEDAHGRRPGAGGLRPCAEPHWIFYFKGKPLKYLRTNS